jgi:hypothetical protein
MCSLEQRRLVDIVNEKYAVIQDVATWKMSVPGRAFEIYVLVTHTTTGGEGSTIEGEHDLDFRLRTCITNYKNDCWNGDHNSFVPDHIESPYL